MAPSVHFPSWNFALPGGERERQVRRPGPIPVAFAAGLGRVAPPRRPPPVRTPHAQKRTPPRPPRPTVTPRDQAPRTRRRRRRRRVARRHIMWLLNDIIEPSSSDEKSEAIEPIDELRRSSAVRASQPRRAARAVVTLRCGREPLRMRHTSSLDLTSRRLSRRGSRWRANRYDTTVTRPYTIYDRTHLESCEPPRLEVARKPL